MKKELKHIVLAVMFMFFINITPVEAKTTSLPEAQNGVITLTEDVELTSTYKVNETLTIDLAGHTIYGESALNKNYELIHVGSKGNLTIKDSKGEGKISFKYIGESGNWGYYSNTISSNGILTLESGTVENITNVGSHIYMAIDNNSNGVPAVLNIEGGKVECANYIAIRQFANTAKHVNDVNVSGGTITGGKRGIWTQSTNANQNKASVNITGGTVSNVYMTTNSSENMSLSISKNPHVADIILSSSNVTVPAITITGGTFGIDVAEYLDSESGLATYKDDKGIFHVGTPSDVVIKETSNGKVTSSLVVAIEGQKVQLITTPESSYELGKLVVLDSENKEVEIVDGVFTMPAGKVTVTAEFTKIIPPMDYVTSGSETEDNKIGVVESETIKETLDESLKADTELSKKVEEERQQGNKVTIEITMDELNKNDVKEEEKQMILQTVTAKQKVHQYFDISVLVKTTEKELGKLTKLTEKMKFSMEISEDLIQEGRTFYILKLHNDEVKRINGKLNGTKLEFESDEFSTFALVYEDKIEDKIEEKVETNEETSEEQTKEETQVVEREKDETPKTGAINIPAYVWVSIAGFALIGLATTKKSCKHSK